MGRAEELKQLEDDTKRMIENRTKDKEEEKAPLLAKEEKKGSEEKEQVVSDDLLNMKLGTVAALTRLGEGLETGKYHLVGVVTHKGRYADSGHYVGWTYHKQSTALYATMQYRHVAQVRR